jgi:hypothetical protein
MDLYIPIGIARNFSKLPEVSDGDSLGKRYPEDEDGVGLHAGAPDI